MVVGGGASVAVAVGSVGLGEGDVVAISDGLADAAGDEAATDCLAVPLSGRAGMICGVGTAAAECAVSPLARLGVPDDAERTAPVELAGPALGRVVLPVSTVDVAVTDLSGGERPAPAGAVEAD